MCRTESMVVKCGECGELGIETWFCPDCLDEQGECGRCLDRAEDRASGVTCGALGGALSVSDERSRADLGRGILTQAYQVSESIDSVAS